MASSYTYQVKAATADCMPNVLQVGRYAVPKGTELNLSAWCMHRDEQWWQDAEHFKPERWLGDPAGGDKTGGLAYVPFGAGARMCIGYKLACKLFPFFETPV